MIDQKKWQKYEMEKVLPLVKEWKIRTLEIGKFFIMKL